MHKITFAAVVTAVAALFPAAASARLSSPGLVGPRSGASSQELPAISWRAVRGAAEYEYEISADAHFSSIVGSGPGQGTGRTHNLAAALDKVVPDGAYSWRVRGLTAKGAAGAWSRARTIVKRWTVAPRIVGGSGMSLSWPASSLVLRWTSVPYAVKYIVTIATDPALSNQVLGSVAQPAYTQASSFVLPGTLADGSYFWAVTPVDAEGHRGVRSQLATFGWTWPTSTSTILTDLNPDPRVFDPFFSWNPVPGAARYEVEINSASDFPPGSKWCCSTPTIGTSVAPQQVLANNAYYWRARALDADGHAGQWNYGTPFTKAFDSVTPTIPNLTVSDANGHPLSGVPVSTDTPIVTWDPVPGASRYELEVGLWNGSYCDFSTGTLYHIQTATTAWTPAGSLLLAHPGPTAWPHPQYDVRQPVPGHSYCVRVLARSDDDAKQQQVTSTWTYINAGGGPGGGPGPAFSYSSQPSSATGQTFQQYVQTGQYLLPANASSLPRTPWFSWNWLPGAKAYWVVVARDALFTQVVDVGLTDIPAYAPRLANGMPLSDETTSYYWAVIPAPNLDGSGFGDDDPTQDHPQTFNKSSTPPMPLAPATGASVSTWPTFRWTAAESSRSYTLQVSQDPSFGSLLDNVTTDATAYTSSTTYPADTVLYWRVRGSDWIGQGLNWSQVQTFTRTLPGASPAVGNPTGGNGSGKVWSWTGVPGAVAYDVHIDQGDGTSSDFTVDSAAFAATAWHGIGTIRWQVRPMFPTTGFSTVGGPFFAPRAYVQALAAPVGARGIKSGSRLVISWNPDPAAKRYEVQVGRADSFSLGTVIDQHQVDGMNWAPDIDFSLPTNHGRIYWRVAALDTYGSTGSFATGSFANGRAVTKHKPRRRRKHK